jgi:4-hydroxybenzoate polyprenyltransferase
VAGTITEATLRICIGIALLGALIVSLLSPLGVSGSAIHFLGLLSATAYNLKLKSTLFSVVPYMISFGALPWAIYVAAGTSPPIWIVLGFILIASAFHFLNVLKDMESDVGLGILGLPQVIGRKRSVNVAIVLIGLGILDVALGNLG